MPSWQRNISGDGWNCRMAFSSARSIFMPPLSVYFPDRVRPDNDVRPFEPHFSPSITFRLARSFSSMSLLARAFTRASRAAICSPTVISISTTKKPTASRSRSVQAVGLVLRLLQWTAIHEQTHEYYCWQVRKTRKAHRLPTVSLPSSGCCLPSAGRVCPAKRWRDG